MKETIRILEAKKIARQNKLQLGVDYLNGLKNNFRNSCKLYRKVFKKVRKKERRIFLNNSLFNK